MVGRKMNDDNERQAAIFGYVLEKRFERRQPAGGSPDSDHGWQRF